MMKILTAQFSEQICNSLISYRISPDERKGCRKRTKGTEELLSIDQHILNESKTRRKISSYGLDRLKNLQYGPSKLDTTLSENV